MREEARLWLLVDVGGRRRGVCCREQGEERDGRVVALVLLTGGASGLSEEECVHGIFIAGCALEQHGSLTPSRQGDGWGWGLSVVLVEPVGAFSKE